MPDIYKHGYDNFKKITVLFILQIILGVLPVVLLVIYIGFSLYSNVVLGYTFIVIMAIAAALNFSITKRYNVLLSGFKGEKSLMKTVKKLGSEYTVFANVPVRYKKNRSEIDLLVMCDRYIIIIEVKNHSGYIYGNHKDETWTQRKIYRDGKTTETVHLLAVNNNSIVADNRAVNGLFPGIAESTRECAYSCFNKSHSNISFRVEFLIYFTKLKSLTSHTRSAISVMPLPQYGHFLPFADASMGAPQLGQLLENTMLVVCSCRSCL